MSKRHANSRDLWDWAGGVRIRAFGPLTANIGRRVSHRARQWRPPGL